MFESSEALARQIEDLLDAVRQEAAGRYAALAEPKSILFESSEGEGWMLRRFLEPRTAALFAIPEAMAGEGPAEDVFAEWDDDEFLLAFVNGRVALVVACPDAEAARARVERPLRILADRLLRYNQRWRVDRRGDGLFFGRPKLDVVVVGKLDR